MGKIKMRPLPIPGSICDMCDTYPSSVRIIEIQGDEITSFHGCVDCAVKRRNFRVLEQKWED